MNDKFAMAELSDEILLSRLTTTLAAHQRLEAELLALIGEIDRRKLFLPAGCSSMFAYSVEVLRCSEATAYKRITVARVARAYPQILAMVERGELHLSGLSLLAPHLTNVDGDGEALLAAAVHKSKRQIEHLLAQRFPKPDVPTIIRKLPTAGAKSTNVGQAAAEDLASKSSHVGSEKATTAQQEAPDPVNGDRLEPGRVGSSPSREATAVPPSRPTIVAPLSPARYKVQFTASQQLCDKLAKARSLLSHRLPIGAVDQILELALDALIEKAEKAKLAKTTKKQKVKASEGDAKVATTTPSPAARGSKSRPLANDSKPEVNAAGPASRHIPNPIKRQVDARDGQRCTFVSPEGRRCSQTAFLQFHHLHPFGQGGGHSLENIRVCCAAHNAWFAEQDYGADYIKKARQRC